MYMITKNLTNIRTKNNNHMLIIEKGKNIYNQYSRKFLPYIPYNSECDSDFMLHVLPWHNPEETSLQAIQIFKDGH